MLFVKIKYALKNRIKGMLKVAIAASKFILIVLIEICEKIIISIPLTKILILKFLNLSLLLDFKIINDAIIHKIGI